MGGGGLSFFSPNEKAGYTQEYFSKLEINSLKNQTKFLQSQANQHIKNELLTQILMKDPFAIFANGALYKKGRPGSKTYDPLTVWEPYKYITGDIKEDEFNDILQNRSHLKLAGNKDYFTHVWDEPQWQTPDRNRINKHLHMAYAGRIKEVKQAFEELSRLGLYGHNINDYYNSQIDSVPKPNFIKPSRYAGYS